MSSIFFSRSFICYFFLYLCAFDIILCKETNLIFHLCFFPFTFHCFSFFSVGNYSLSCWPLKIHIWIFIFTVWFLLRIFFEWNFPIGSYWIWSFYAILTSKIEQPSIEYRSGLPINVGKFSSPSPSQGRLSYFQS